MLYSTNSGMKALFTALNVIYDKEERRSFLRLHRHHAAVHPRNHRHDLSSGPPWSIAVPVDPARGSLGLSGGSLARTISLLRWPVMFVSVAMALASSLPLRTKSRTRILAARDLWQHPGRALLVVLCSALFSWFTDRFASLAITYGSLSTIVAFMLWLWVIFLIVLTCAELDSCIEHEIGLYRSEAAARGVAE